jgi:pimeloyl-ACP methyl ester carboxylesterase
MSITPRMTRSPRRRHAERVLLADGRRVQVRRWPGSGIPVVLLHGLFDSAAGWSSTARALSEPAIAIDLAGFGRSDLPTRPHLSAYAEDVVEVLTRLRLGRFVLVGHSLGGGVAAAVAERMADDVAALILLAPAGFGRVPLAEAALLPGVCSVVRRVLPIALKNRLLVSATYSTVVTGGAAPEEHLLSALNAASPTIVPAACDATRAIAAAGRSPRAFHRRGVHYHGQVYAVWGSRDRVVPVGHLANVRRAFPHVQTDIWDGMGHHHQREQPSRLVDLIGHACAGHGRMHPAARPATAVALASAA